MTPTIAQVQATLSPLPPHVLHVDMLVFRNREMEAPTPWQQLTSWCGALLAAVQTLRAHRLDSIEERWAEAPLSTYCDPPVFRMSSRQLDRLTEDELLDAQRWAADRAEDRVPCRDPAREQLAMLIEERLFDVVLEAAYALRRQRRYPRLPPEKNPLLPHLPVARRSLRPEVRDEFERLTGQMGPIPPSEIATP